MIPVKSFQKKPVLKPKNDSLTGLAGMTYVKPAHPSLKKQASMIDEYLYKLSTECKACTTTKVKKHTCNSHKNVKGEK